MGSVSSLTEASAVLLKLFSADIFNNMTHGFTLDLPLQFAAKLDQAVLKLQGQIIFLDMDDTKEV